MNKDAWEHIVANGTLAWRYSYSKNKIICEEIYIIFKDDNKYVRAWSKERKISYIVYAEEKVPHNGMVWLKEKDDRMAADLLIGYFINKLKAVLSEKRYLADKINTLYEWKESK